jgi:hypothetical protein
LPFTETRLITWKISEHLLTNTNLCVPLSFKYLLQKYFYKAYWTATDTWVSYVKWPVGLSCTYEALYSKHGINYASLTSYDINVIFWHLGFEFQFLECQSLTQHTSKSQSLCNTQIKEKGDQCGCIKIRLDKVNSHL